MRRLVIAVLVLAGLLVAVDFGAAALAESAVSRQMREQIGLADDPSVRINGFPFLTQALSGEYSSVDVSADRISVGRLDDLSVYAHLSDVTAPLPMLLGSGPKTLRIEKVEGTVRIPAESLESRLPAIEDLRIENVNDYVLEQAVSDGADESLTKIDPDNAARFVGTTTLLGEEVEVAVIAVLELVDGEAKIVPRDIRLGGDDAPRLPDAAQRTLRQLFTMRLDPGSLPLEVTPTSLEARGGALEISGEARDLVLGSGSRATTG
jgi:hypothetical protein